MANDACMRSAFAKYGETHTRPEYQLLMSVTHWTPEEVALQAAATQRTHKPDFILDRNFGQILEYVSFQPQQI
jgi:hypothetical protein